MCSGLSSITVTSFPGEQEPTIDRDTFDKVQQLIKSRGVSRSARRQDSGTLLKGWIFEDRGQTDRGWQRETPHSEVRALWQRQGQMSAMMRTGRGSAGSCYVRISPSGNILALPTYRADFLCGGTEHARAQALLRARYSQLGEMNIEGLPVIAVRLERVVSWGDLSVDRLSRAGARD